MINIILFYFKLFLISILLASNPLSLDFLLYKIDNNKWGNVIRMSIIYYIWNFSNNLPKIFSLNELIYFNQIRNLLKWLIILFLIILFIF